MKICLINPPADTKSPILPLGLAYLAAVLEENNFQIRVIDAWAENMNARDISQRLKKMNPDIIGVTIMTPKFQVAMETIDKAKKVCPKSLIIVGGPHPSALPKETLKSNKNINIAVIGEAEDTILEIARSKSKNDWKNIRGITYRIGNKIYENERRKPITDLDSLPPPARHLFPMKNYRTHPPYGKENPYTNVITSRGCPFKCGYCSKSVFGHSFRALSPERVISEIEFLIKRYGIKEIHFYDDDFTMDMGRAEEICDLILRKKINFIWSCTTRVNLVSPKLLKKMKLAGCWLISYGVESGNQKILDRICKNITIPQVKKAFCWTRHIGIKTLGFFIVGLPGDDWITIRQTINLAKIIKPDFTSWCVLIILPGSGLYQEIQDGLLDKKKVKIYSSVGHDLARSPYAHGISMSYEDNLTIKELNKAVSMAYKEFYLRPEYILNTFKNIRSLGELVHYARGAWEMLSWVIKPEISN